MKMGKYEAVIGYGLLPFMAFYYLTNVLLRLYVVGMDPTQILLDVICAVFYLMAALFLTMSGKFRMLQAAIVFEVLRIPLENLLHLRAEDENPVAAIGGEIFTIVICAAWFVWNIVYVRKKQAEVKEISEEEEFRNRVKKRKNKKAAAVINSILVALALMSLVLLMFVIIENWYYIITTVLTKGRTLTVMQQKNLGTAVNAITTLSQAGFAFWLAFVLDKADIVPRSVLGLPKEKRALMGIPKGFVIALLVIIAASVLLLMMGCGLEANHVSKRIVQIMFWAFVSYIGVGISEEIVCRGAMLGYCEKMGMKVWGVILSTACFVGLHFMTGAYNKLPQAVFLAAGGLLFAALKLNHSNLWLAIGYHIMYDWMICHLVEIRTLGNRESFVSALKFTYWQQSICISIPVLMVAILIFVMEIRRARD